MARCSAYNSQFTENMMVPAARVLVLGILGCLAVQNSVHATLPPYTSDVFISVNSSECNLQQNPTTSFRDGCFNAGSELPPGLRLLNSSVDVNSVFNLCGQPFGGFFAFNSSDCSGEPINIAGPELCMDAPIFNLTLALVCKPASTPAVFRFSPREAGCASGSPVPQADGCVSNITIERDGTVYDSMLVACWGPMPYSFIQLYTGSSCKGNSSAILPPGSCLNVTEKQSLEEFSLIVDCNARPSGPPSGGNVSFSANVYHQACPVPVAPVSPPDEYLIDGCLASKEFGYFDLPGAGTMQSAIISCNSPTPVFAFFNASEDCTGPPTIVNYANQTCFAHRTIENDTLINDMAIFCRTFNSPPSVFDADVFEGCGANRTFGPPVASFIDFQCEQTPPLMIEGTLYNSVRTHCRAPTQIGQAIEYFTLPGCMGANFTVPSPSCVTTPPELGNITFTLVCRSPMFETWDIFLGTCAPQVIPPTTTFPFIDASCVDLPYPATYGNATYNSTKAFCASSSSQTLQLFTSAGCNGSTLELGPEACVDLNGLPVLFRCRSRSPPPTSPFTTVQAYDRCNFTGPVSFTAGDQCFNGSATTNFTYQGVTYGSAAIACQQDGFRLYGIEERSCQGVPLRVVARNESFCGSRESEIDSELLGFRCFTPPTFTPTPMPTPRFSSWSLTSTEPQYVAPMQCSGPINRTDLFEDGCMSSFRLGLPNGWNVMNVTYRSVRSSCTGNLPDAGLTLFTQDYCQGNATQSSKTVCASADNGTALLFRCGDMRFTFDWGVVGNSSNQTCNPLDVVFQDRRPNDCFSANSFGEGANWNVDNSTYYSLRVNCDDPTFPFTYYSSYGCIGAALSITNRSTCATQNMARTPARTFFAQCDSPAIGAADPGTAPVLFRSEGNGTCDAFNYSPVSGGLLNGCYSRNVIPGLLGWTLQTGASSIYNSAFFNCTGNPGALGSGIQLFENDACTGASVPALQSRCLTMIKPTTNETLAAWCRSSSAQFSPGRIQSGSCTPGLGIVTMNFVPGCNNVTTANFDKWKVNNVTYLSVFSACAQPGGTLRFFTTPFCTGNFTTDASSICFEQEKNNVTTPALAYCVLPTTKSPTRAPTRQPTKAPTILTSAPSKSPSKANTTAPTSRAPSKTPTFRPTQAPSQAPTGRTPQVNDTRLTNDLGRIEVLFDADTNQRGSPARGPCAPWLTLIVPDSGCDGAACPLACVWTSSRSLAVELNAQSNFQLVNASQPLRIQFANSSNVRNPSATSASVTGTFTVSVDLERVVSPSVLVSGPRTVPLCGSGNVVLLSTVTGTGGRAPKYEWRLNGAVIPAQNASRLELIRPQVEDRINYTLTVTNYAGKAAVSAPFDVFFSASARPQVVIGGPSSFTVDAGARLELGVDVSLPSACLGPNATAGSASFRYDWRISTLDNTTVPTQNLTLRNPRLVINPASLLPPGNTYRIEVSVDPRVPGVLPGTASVLATVNFAPIVAIARVSPASAPRSEPFALNAARSCNPNRASPPCTASSGQSKADISALSFSWRCTVADTGADCTTFLQGSESANATLPAFALNASTACDVSVNVSSQGLWAVSTPVRITVMADPPPQCVVPRIRMLAFPSKINVGESGEAVIRAEVEAFAESAPNNELVWFKMEQGVPVGERLSVGRPNLALPMASLVPGSTYAFRVFARQPCTEPDNHPFADIVFTTNSPPAGGVLTVSPLSARAGLDEFTLFVDGAIDEDLPLQYLFEYRTNFASDVAGSPYLTLSSFSSSSSVKTRFSEASRILVLVRVRDALNAVSPRSASPFVDNIQATAIVATPESLPFNAASQIADLQSQGGSGEDALRVASALAAAAASSSTGSTDAAVVQWQQETQSALLNLVVDSAPVENPDPSFVMLQASTLGSILSSAAAVQDIETPEGKQFLKKAADFVGNLLASAKTAVLAQGGDENDPLLAQLLPPDLGTVSLGSLTSILDAIRSSSLAVRRRLRRRLLRGEHVDFANERRALEAASTQVVGSVRSQLRLLAETLLLGAVSGSAPQEVAGVSMRVVLVTETPDLIGQENKLRSITVPGFSAQDKPTVFTLPSGVLGAFGLDSTELIKIVAVRFRFNIRELAGTVLLPNYTLDENAPASNITEMLALDFQRNASEAGILHPFDLDERIQIRIPLTWEPPNNTTRPACGFYNDTLDVWSSNGCNVTELRLPTGPSDTGGYLVCSCNHASDYAAWQAFIKDVNSVFNPVDASNLSTIAALVLGVLLPVLILAWLASQRVGRYLDDRDTLYVHYGAFVALTRRKIELHDRQRRFFRFLRQNKGPVAHTDIVRLKAEAEARERREAGERMEKEFARLVNRLIALAGVGSLVAGALCLIGSFVPYFFAGDAERLSMAASIFPKQKETFGLALASAALSLIAALAVVDAYVRRGGQMAQSRLATGRFQLMTSSQVLAAPLAIAAFSLGAAHRDAVGGVGVGLGLLIAGALVAVLAFVFGFGAFLLHQHGSDSRRLGMEFVRNILRGMMYEQTLVSAWSRFDPFFNRQRRFSIILAMIVGNLFASSVFFALRQGQDVSFGLVFASTFISSLIVAVPVKIILRLLFRLTRSRSGSKLDRIAQIFRITAFSYDVQPTFASEAEKLDVAMLDGFRRFYLTKHNFKLLERHVKVSLKTGSDDKALTERRKEMMKMFASNGREDSPAGPELKVAGWTNRQTGEFFKVTTNGGSTDSREVLNVREVVVKQGEVTPELVMLAKQQLHTARETLKDAIERSRKAWEKHDHAKWSSVARKQQMVSEERNALLKLAMALAEEPRARPKVFESRLPSYWSALAWLILSAYFLGCIVWICFWIFSRNGQSRDSLIADGNENPTNAEIAAQTNAYLLAWLGVSFFGVFLSYFVFEPSLVILRYAVLPLCIKTLRPEMPSIDDVGQDSSSVLALRPDGEDKAEPPDEEYARSVGCVSRVLCCGCCRNARSLSTVEKRATDGLIIVVEALV